MSPKTPHRSLVRGPNGSGANGEASRHDSSSNPAPAAMSASFDVKFKGHKTWTVTTRVDLGPDVHDEARFRDAASDVSWAELETFSREVGVSLPPPLHILLPALRGSLIRRWLELVAVERGVNTVLQFLHTENIVLAPVRLNRVFSRAFDEVPVNDQLILG